MDVDNITLPTTVEGLRLLIPAHETVQIDCTPKTNRDLPDCFPVIFFFKYNRVLPPLSRDEARICLASFVLSVLEAVVDLHECGRTHLDIRLENICFSREHQGLLTVN